MWFVSPQPHPGRAPVVLSVGAAAGALTVTSFWAVSVVRARVVIASSAFADFSLATLATDDACSGSDALAAVPVRSAETETDALVASDVVSSRVDAPAICARSTMTASTVAVRFRDGSCARSSSEPRVRAQVNSPLMEG